MKKNLIIAVVFVVLMAWIPKAQAQFSLGLKVAGNYTNFIKLSEFDLGGDAGIFMRFGDRFYFQPEANYSFRSTTFKGVASEIDNNFKLKQHFIDVPLLLGYHFIDNENFKFHIFLGPRLGIQIHDNQDEMGSIALSNQKMQWGGQIGVGFDFWRFTLDARYDISGNKYSIDGGDSETMRQNMIVLSLGFKIVK